MTDRSTVSDLDQARWAFHEELLDAGLLREAGSPGLYARSGVFEDVLTGLDSALTASMSSLGAERLRFPPVFARAEFERTDYIVSFPDLAATINVFSGSDQDHAKLVAARANGAEWDSWMAPSETVMVPAACHPLYERLTGTLPAGGLIYDIAGTCFRHEPSIDPMRMQSFRQHEYVYIGEKEKARAFRESVVARYLELLLGLGLDVSTVAANDPFFGRAGRMLARTQLADELKVEFVVPIYGALEESTAIGSGNLHNDHFGATFGIQTSDGAVANSACVGMGLERVTLSLFRTHGMVPARWGSDIRSQLGLDE